MESDIFQAIQAGGNVGLLMIGLVLLRLERRVIALEMHKKYKCPHGFTNEHC